MDTALAHVASGVVAPMLVGYALWVASEARRRGIKRLYDAARDGQVMFKIARHVMARVAPDIEVRYLYGSRQAWVASASAFSDDVLRRWLVVPRDATGRTTLRRVGLDVDELYHETQLPFLRGDRADQISRRTTIASSASGCSASLFSRGSRLRPRRPPRERLAYLRQEGLYDGTPSALVDSGWGGMTAHALDVLLTHEGGNAVSHFFVGRTNSSRPQPGRHSTGCTRPGCSTSTSRPHSMVGLQAPTVLVEMLCAGTEGRTISYRRENDGWHPVFAAAQNDPALAWGVEHVHEIAERTAELVAAHLPEPGSVDCAPLAWELLTLFWNTAHRQRRRYLGSIPVGGGGRDPVPVPWPSGSRRAPSPAESCRAIPTYGATARGGRGRRASAASRGRPCCDRPRRGSTPIVVVCAVLQEHPDEPDSLQRR